MHNPVTLRGYAIPFNRTRAIGGDVEMIDRHAFDGMLDAPPRVPLLWDTHDVSTPGAVLAKSVRLFADDYGLGFEAQCSMEHWQLRAMMKANKPTDRCSVGEFVISETQRAVKDGIPCDLVTRATVGHIAITADAAYGDQTAAWTNYRPVQDAAWRIQTMAATWEAGHRVWRAESQKKATSIEAALQKGKPIGKTVTGRLVMASPSGKLSVWPPQF